MSRGSSFSIANQKGERIAIVAGLRTPFLRQLTEFTHVPAVELGKLLVAELLERTEINPNFIEQLVFGQVIQMPNAPNIAREIVLGTQLPPKTDAYSLTRACTTSFQTIANLADSITLGHVNVGIAGGADSASVLPIGLSPSFSTLLLKLAKVKKSREKFALLNSLKLRDLLPKAPAIVEYSTGVSMGETAEQMAKSYGILRKEQDAFAHRSHQLASKAWQAGFMANEVMTVFPFPYRCFSSKDNTIRPHSDLDSYAKLPPVFDKKQGTVTAANSSPLTDGAAALLMMSEGKAKALGYSPLGYLHHYAFSAAGVSKDMLMGPVYASAKVLQKAGMSLTDMRLIDMHEAFSAQVLANLKVFDSTKFATERLGLKKALGQVEMDKFNQLGGSIAYGHPFAATGARMVLQSLNALKRCGGGLALTTACAAGGLGAAMILEVDG